MTAVIRIIRLEPDGSVPSVMSWAGPIGNTGMGLRFLSKGMILFILLWFYRYGNVTAIWIGISGLIFSIIMETRDSGLVKVILPVSPSFSVAKTKFPA